MNFYPLDLVFPPRCVHCHRHLAHGRALCVTCARRVVLHRTFFCGRCRARRYSAQGLCHQNFPFALAAAGEYEDPILKNVIRSLKFHFVRVAANPIGILLTVYAKRIKIADNYDLVLPLPLSRRRQRERGFNQSELIAQIFGARTGLPVCPNVILRTRHASPQSDLKDYATRQANVAGSFSVASTDKVHGRKIVLIDDVVTSGATMLAAATTLRKAGAKTILALAVAKA